MRSGGGSNSIRKMWPPLILTLIAFGLLLAGCETIPPAMSKNGGKPISDIKEIVGKWEGTGEVSFFPFQSNRGSVRETEDSLFIKQDGSLEGTSLSSRGRVIFKGKVTLTSGHIKSESTLLSGPFTGQTTTGTYTLYKEGGKEVLKFKGVGSSGANVSSTYRRAKQQ